MCGIAGILQLESTIDASANLAPLLDSPHCTLLEEMTARLAHRGPDGIGHWLGEEIGLGHTRLAILDPSPRAAQPMFDAENSAVLVYNGELYNFQDLRRQLKAKGCTFRTTSDSEVVLYALREWGPKALEKFTGIFSLAFWNLRSKRLLLARDPLGVKPLFYAQQGGLFRFASEVKSLLADQTLSSEIDYQALDSFFTFAYTPAPQTGLTAIRQLQPGTYLEVAQGSVSHHRYWSLSASVTPRRGSFGDHAEAFEALMDEVTASQMISDVGCGAFLSGGLDSALVLRSMVRASSEKQRAFCMGFGDAAFDERCLASQTAKALQVELHSEVLSQDPVSLVQETSYYLEEPTADSSSLAVFKLCQAAKQYFPVALSGDGADELLAGYPTYQASMAATVYRLIPGPLRRRIMNALCRLTPVRDEKYSWHKVLTRFRDGAELGPFYDHASWRIMFTEQQKKALYTSLFSTKVSAFNPLQEYVNAMERDSGSRLQARMQGDLMFYLPNDMLVKVDRMSMAHGLEVRVPFLDQRIVGFCASLPDRHRLPWGIQRKQLIKSSLAPSLPSSVLKAPKSGFNVPLERWMREQLHELLLDLVSTHRVEVAEYFCLDVLEKMVTEHRSREVDHAHRLFTVLMFVQWLENLRSAFRQKRVESIPLRFNQVKMQ